MPLSEKKLVGRLVKFLRKNLKCAVVFKHADRITSGIPDISVTWRGFIIWIEVKFANPEFKSKEIQEFTMIRLATVGIAFYVIYDNSVDPVRIIIQPPDFLPYWNIDPHISAGSFDNKIVADVIRRSVKKAQNGSRELVGQDYV